MIKYPTPVTYYHGQYLPLDEVLADKKTAFSGSKISVQQQQLHEFEWSAKCAQNVICAI